VSDLSTAQPSSYAAQVAKARDELVTDAGVAIAWAASTNARPFANLGDALSPVMISAMSRLPIVRRDFDFAGPRLVVVGTIAHGQRNGSVHIWGTGMDGRIDPYRVARHYVRPPETEFTVHATRGPYTRDILRGQGIEAPPIYGDPVWFLPRLMPRRVAPRHELGVILHLTELDGYSPEAAPKEIFKRYQIPESLAGSIRIISPIADRTLEALEAKIDEILSCRRIASTSLHGLVIAETYGVPCAWFSTAARGGALLRVGEDGEQLDHRVRDFYAGAGKQVLPIFGSDRAQATSWEDLIDWIDRTWAPLDYDPTAFFDAYPLPKAVSLAEPVWPPDREAIAKITL
jgi:hypothetical protein